MTHYTQIESKEHDLEALSLKKKYLFITKCNHCIQSMQRYFHCAFVLFDGHQES